MNKFASSCLFLLCGLYALPALAESAVIAPGKVHEECFALAAGQSGTYSFNAPDILGFNIHYHENKEVFYLAGPFDQLEGEGVFTAPLGQTYCLMWSNRSPTEVVLQYSYVLQTVSPASVPDRIRY